MENDESTSKEMYTKLIAKIEQISKLIYFVTVQLSYVGGVLPPLLLTLINYFIYDLHDESFQEIQMMYVCSMPLFSLFSDKIITNFDVFFT